MQIEFLDEKQFDDAFESGRFSKRFRGEDVTEEWNEQEEALIGKLFEERDIYYSEEQVYVNGDTQGNCIRNFLCKFKRQT